MQALAYCLRVRIKEREEMWKLRGKKKIYRVLRVGMCLLSVWNLACKHMQNIICTLKNAWWNNYSNFSFSLESETHWDNFRKMKSIVFNTWTDPGTGTQEPWGSSGRYLWLSLFHGPCDFSPKGIWISVHSFSFHVFLFFLLLWSFDYHIVVMTLWPFSCGVFGLQFLREMPHKLNIC